MVYLHFPSNLTEEELMLQAKYQKLKKKKKALQALKAPKQEPEKPILPKRPTEARDAREIARKLIKSGAIQAIKSPPPQPQNATFKRPRAGRERKLSGSAGAAGGVASYQPFSASQEPPPPEEKLGPRVKYLYDSFVTARDKEEKARNLQSAGPAAPVVPGAPGPIIAPGTPVATGAPAEPATPPAPIAPTSGKTSVIQVTGARISEETIRRRLAACEPFTFHQEPDDDKAFLSFETPEIASQALTSLEGLEDSWRIAVARNRPPQPTTWTPGPHGARSQVPPKDAKRTLLTYDDIFD